MMRFFYHFIGAVFFLSLSLSGETIRVAPIRVLQEGDAEQSGLIDYREALLAECAKLNNVFSLRLEVSAPGVQNILSVGQAREVSALYGYEYLLYGWVECGSYSIEGELRLYGREENSYIFTIYHKDSIDREERFRNEIGRKFLSELSRYFGLEEGQEERTKTRIAVFMDAGNWNPIDSKWLPIILGTLDIRLGLSVISDIGKFQYRGGRVFLGLDICGGYRLALSREANMDFYFHEGFLGIGLRFGTDIYKAHRLSLDLINQWVINGSYYRDRYDETKRFTANVYGLSLEILYGYAFTGRVSLRLVNGFDLVFYNPLSVRYRLGLGFEFDVFKKEDKR